MLRALFTSSLLLTLGGGFSACSTVPQSVKTIGARHQAQSIPYSASNVQKAEAAMVCENDNMRSRAVDHNMKNDMARVLILEEGGRASNVIADVEVNCRDYFQNQQSRASKSAETIPTYTITQTAPTPNYTPQVNRTIIEAPAPATTVQKAPRVVKAVSTVQAADGYYYSIKKGDTLYGIARDNCSSVKDISLINGISDPTKIEIHQIIRLPAQKCNSRK